MKAQEFPRLISSYRGEIEQVLLVYPGIATQAGDQEYDEIIEVFKAKGDVFRFRQEAKNFKLKLSSLREDGDVKKDRRFRAVHQLRPGLDVVRMLQSWRLELKAIRDSGRLLYRRWAQDPFLVLEWGGSTVLLESLHNKRLCDFFLPLEIAQQAGPDFLIKPTRLYIEGGNVLCGDRCAFVGRDMVVENMQLLGVGESEVIEGLSAAFGGIEVLVVGSRSLRPKLIPDVEDIEESYQPLFHIDLFMNFGGRDSTSGNEIVVLGSPEQAVKLLEEMPSAKTRMGAENSQLMGRFLEIKQDLLEDSFEVVELPLFIYRETCYSWNNCLVEIYGEQKCVYLPSYQCDNDPEKLNPIFQRLEKAVEDIYDSLGFEVVWFRKGRLFRVLARQCGSLHCFVKVLSRRPSSPP